MKSLMKSINEIAEESKDDSPEREVWLTYLKWRYVLSGILRLPEVWI